MKIVLSCLAIASALLIFVLEILLATTPDYIAPYGQKLTDIVVNLSLSYISGFIFYLLTIHIPEVRRRKRVSVLVNKTTDHISRLISLFFQPAMEGQKYGEIPTDKAVIAWAEQTELYSKGSPGPLKQVMEGTWTYDDAVREWLVVNLIKEIESMSFFSSGVEAEYLECIYELKRCSLIEVSLNRSKDSVVTIAGVVGSKPKLSYYNDKFVELLAICRKLQELTEKYYKT
ncbi:TPA: hypothetical protein RSW51_004422 [Vibrio vulnificus]|nr:hypothetical protein [Vibrio vulnificus]HEB2779456.1 hypothetical protein [Vibrio vulnificus]